MTPQTFSAPGAFVRMIRAQYGLAPISDGWKSLEYKGLQLSQIKAAAFTDDVKEQAWQLRTNSSRSSRAGLKRKLSIGPSSKIARLSNGRHPKHENAGLCVLSRAEPCAEPCAAREQRVSTLVLEAEEVTCSCKTSCSLMPMVWDGTLAPGSNVLSLLCQGDLLFADLLESGHIRVHQFDHVPTVLPFPCCLLHLARRTYGRAQGTPLDPHKAISYKGVSLRLIGRSNNLLRRESRNG